MTINQGLRQAAQKRISALTLEPFAIAVGISMGKPLVDWIHASLDLSPTRKSGSVVSVSIDNKAQATGTSATRSSRRSRSPRWTRATRRRRELLGSIGLSQVGIFSLSPEKAEANKDAIARFTVELYVEKMTFNLKSV